MKKYKIIIPIITLLILFLMSLFPFKKAISLDDTTKVQENTYICEYTASAGPIPFWRTSSPDNTQIDTEFVELNGNSPINQLNKQTFFHFSNNKFLVQGEIIGKKVIDSDGSTTEYYFKDYSDTNEILNNHSPDAAVYNIIDVTDWEIIKPIERGDSFQLFASKNHLNIYDYIF